MYDVAVPRLMVANCIGLAASPASDRFHEKFDFSEIGQALLPDRGRRSGIS
jgi:predicted GNAT superfamily acetyltransferase